MTDHQVVSEIAAALTRATGIVAVVLLAAALIWGFAFSAGETGRRLRPAWWLDLHNWLGGAGTAFTGLHVGLAVLAANGTRIIDAIVPFVARNDTTALGLGVIAAWLAVATTFTSWPRRLRHRAAWRVIHLGAVAGAVLATVHALQLGSDAGALAARVGVVLLAAPVTYLLSVRAVGAVTTRRSHHPVGH
jgi:hypothetical protein